jgi:predicted nucleic acid-binding protein
VPDANSDQAIAFARLESGSILLSSLVVLEATNAFELRVFRGHGTRLNAAKAIADLDADAALGIFRILPLPTSVWDLARKLSRKHTATLGTRPLDILQVAIAIALRAGTFLTFDRNQANLARAEELETPISLDHD